MNISFTCNLNIFFIHRGFTRRSYCSGSKKTRGPNTLSRTLCWFVATKWRTLWRSKFRYCYKSALFAYAYFLSNYLKNLSIFICVCKYYSKDKCLLFDVRILNTIFWPMFPFFHPLVFCNLAYVSYFNQ